MRVLTLLKQYFLCFSEGLLKSLLELRNKTNLNRFIGLSLFYFLLCYSFLSQIQAPVLLALPTSKEMEFNTQALQIEANQFFEEGVNYYRNNLYQDAINQFEYALELRHQVGDIYGVARTLNAIGLANYELANYEQAVIAYQQSIDAFSSIGNSEREAMALNNLGLVHKSQGEYTQALERYQRALELFRQVENQLGQAKVLGNIGFVYYRLGMYRQALENYQQSLEFFREIDDLSGEIIVLTDLAFAYLKLGEYDEALNFFNQALSLLEEVSDNKAQGIVLHGIGLSHIQQGNYSLGIRAYKEALNLFQQVDMRLFEGQTLSSLGEAYFAQDQYSQSLTSLEQALLIAREIGDRSSEGLTLNRLGKVYEAQQEYQQATIFYERSLAIAQELGELSRQGLALTQIGRLSNKQGLPELAIVLLKESVNVRESIREGLRELPQELQQSYTNTVADDYRLLADLLLSQGRIIEAQQVLELLKLEELREFSRSARAGLESDDGIGLNPVEQDILDEFTTLVAFGKQVYECEQSNCPELQVYRDQRRRQADRFNQRVTAFVQNIRDNRFNDEFFYDPSRLNETAQEIVAEPGTLLIYPFVTDDQLWLLYTAAGEVAGAVPVSVTQLELGNAVVQFRDLLESPHSDLDDLQATGQQLYDWMIVPLSEEITKNQIDTLVFAQDRVTRYIPMGALWDGNQYLTQRFTLSSILSAELTDMEDRLSPSPSETSILALGLSQAIPPNFDALPNVETELDAIVNEGEDDAQGIYPGLKFLNERFNFDALFTHVIDHRILHIATHGKFVAGTPDDSFLMLGDNTPLSIQQIESLGTDLDDVHLVVLSACETAVGGPDADGIEVAGISSYFLAANRASAVMASLWLVNDCSTSLLMQHFYENLSQGMAKANALREAQLTLLQSEASAEDCENRMFEVAPTGDAAAASHQTAAPDYTHPYYWAPFILIGNGL